MLHGKLWPVQNDAWEWLKKLSPNIHSLLLDPAEMQNLLARNEAQVAVLFDGRIWTMQDAGVPVRYVIPKEGLYANLDYFSIPMGRRTGISLSTCSTLRSSLRLNAPSAPPALRPDEPKGALQRRCRAASGCGGPTSSGSSSSRMRSMWPRRRMNGRIGGTNGGPRSSPVTPADRLPRRPSTVRPVASRDVRQNGALLLSGVSKRFGDVEAVADVGLTVDQGSSSACSVRAAAGRPRRSD